MSTSELDPVTTEPITHFAPTEKRERQQDVMCGYVAPGDKVSTDRNSCTCPECLDWITHT
jgi:hypothetical protein